MVASAHVDGVKACREAIQAVVFLGPHSPWSATQAKQALAQLLSIGVSADLPGDLIGNTNRIGRAIADTINRVCDEIRAEHSEAR